MKNIILIGFMGAGKTVVGNLLAKKLKMTYMDIDLVIEAEQGKSINDIFAERGEDSFRNMESGVLGRLQGMKGLVVSTGGGIILNPDNVKRLKQLGPVIYLKASPEKIYSRIKGSGNRPLLNVLDPRKKIEDILKAREPLYRKAADFEIDTTDLTPEEVSGKIMEYAGKGA
jgi:shikimate kinase